MCTQDWHPLTNLLKRVVAGHGFGLQGLHAGTSVAEKVAGLVRRDSREGGGPYSSPVLQVSFNLFVVLVLDSLSDCLFHIEIICAVERGRDRTPLLCCSELHLFVVLVGTVMTVSIGLSASLALSN